MVKDQKAMLESKLIVYQVCYNEAQKTNDVKRLSIIATIIDDLQDELKLLDA
jgi:hypothetical protein